MQQLHYCICIIQFILMYYDILYYYILIYSYIFWYSIHIDAVSAKQVFHPEVLRIPVATGLANDWEVASSATSETPDPLCLFTPIRYPQCLAKIFVSPFPRPQDSGQQFWPWGLVKTGLPSWDSLRLLASDAGHRCVMERWLRSLIPLKFFKEFGSRW